MTSTDVATSPKTDPTVLFGLAEGMHAIEALTAAIGWLQLFERLDTSPGDEAEICRALDLAPRPTHVLLTLLVSLGLLSRDERGVYSLTELAREYALPDSPWSLVPCFAALKDRQPCLDMLAVLRTGRPLGAQEDAGPPPWAAGMSDEDFAEYFLRAIDSRNAYLAHALARELDLGGHRRLLDIAGGSGIYACALVRANPELQATVLEKPPVDAVARRAMERRGLADRVGVLAADMLVDELPAGYDVHLYSNVLHDWEVPEIERLLGSSFEALPPGGRIVIHDALLDEDGGGPLAVAEYSVLLMAFTAGRCYSLAEAHHFLHDAGFHQVTSHPTAVHRALVIASKPA